MTSFWLVVALSAVFFSCPACSDDAHHHGDPDGGDTDADTDTDTDGDSDADWCPELETSCGAPTALESCGDDTLDAPRLIFPLSGRHIRDRRPEIVWEVADGVTQYRLEIARDRAFTDVVYRSGDSEPYPGYDDRLHHIVACDLDCGVHFFRVVSVTSPECEVGSASFTWEMFVGMAPGDLDRDGVPDVAFWSFAPGESEFDPSYLQAWAFFDLDEKGGQVVEPVKVAEIEVDTKEAVFNFHQQYTDAVFPGDTNGDGYADLAIVYSYYDEEGIEESVRTKIFVFSGLRAGVVQSGEDAILAVQSTAGKQYQEESYGSTGNNFRFSDINGDGLTDLAFTLYAPLASTDFPSEMRVFFGRTEPQTDLTFDDADAVVPCPDWCTSDYGFRWGLSMGDVNGDGFGDVVGKIEREGEWYYCFLSAYGSETFFGNVDLPSSVALLEPAAIGQQWGDWAWGRSPEIMYPIGDVDVDGYLEVAGGVLATDVTEPDPVSTGGFLVLQDDLAPGDHAFDTIGDWLFVGGFTVLEEETTEKLSTIQGVGDLDGDAIDDLYFFSRYYGGSPPGRVFTVDGRPAWDTIHDVSLAMDFITIDDSCKLVGMIGDVDGDGINDELHFVNHGIVLSSTGQFIEIYTDLFGFFTWPAIY
ncbi:MAG: hypothetical protein M0R80_11060 [Proteobacteria bacterium]|nr:hypothetical protein [Pseudomonadota bacterium]